MNESLSPELLQKINAYWRAANYLSVGQIYLLDNPLLIRRPLMEVGEEIRVGFDVAAVDAWIGLNNVDLPEGNIEACVHGPEGHGNCGSHAHEDDDEYGESSHGRRGAH